MELEISARQSGKTTRLRFFTLKKANEVHSFDELRHLKK